MSESFDSVCWVVMCCGCAAWKFLVPEFLFVRTWSHRGKMRFQGHCWTHFFFHFQVKQFKNETWKIITTLWSNSATSRLLTGSTTQIGFIFYSPNNFSHGGSYFKYRKTGGSSRFQTLVLRRREEISVTTGLSATFIEKYSFPLQWLTHMPHGTNILQPIHGGVVPGIINGMTWCRSSPWSPEQTSGSHVGIGPIGMHWKDDVSDEHA